MRGKCGSRQGSKIESGIGCCCSPDNWHTGGCLPESTARAGTGPRRTARTRCKGRRQGWRRRCTSQRDRRRCRTKRCRRRRRGSRTACRRWFRTVTSYRWCMDGRRAMRRCCRRLRDRTRWGTRMCRAHRQAWLCWCSCQPDDSWPGSSSCKPHRRCWTLRPGTCQRGKPRTWEWMWRCTPPAAADLPDRTTCTLRTDDSKWQSEQLIHNCRSCMPRWTGRRCSER